MCGLIRRYGAAEPTLMLALLQLLDNCAAVLPAADPARWATIGEHTELILDDATRTIQQPADLAPVRATAQTLLGIVETHLQAGGDSMLNQS